MKRETLNGFGLSKEQIDSVLGEYGKSVSDLKERLSAAEVERDEIKNQFETQKTELETSFTEKQKDFAIQYAMKNADTLDRDIVMSLLDRDKISINEGELTGLDEQLEGLKESKSFLFNKSEPAQETQTPQITFSGNPSAGSFTGKDAFSSITDKYQ